MRYSPQYGIQITPVNTAEVNLLLEKADNFALKAADRETLLYAITAYEEVLLKDVNNYKALTALGNLYLLLGDGYEQSIELKADCFAKAMGYCEQAMLNNTGFKKRITAGEKVWQASSELSIHEIDAMVFWVTSVFYYYKECLGPMGQMINYPWIRRAKTMLAAAESLNAEWGGGIIYLSWGLYYLSLPEAAGGNRVKSAEYFDKAIKTGPDWMMSRWARAKYFHVKMGNQMQFVEDLQWIINQEFSPVRDHMAWKYFFIADAKRLLDDKNNIFR
jgi:tetratricopeptide (TPR) repeat protein